MFEFYEFNTLNASIVLISTFIIYYIFNSNKSKNKEDSLNLDKLIIAAVIGICLSLVVSYIITGKDEKLLSDNYWDNTGLE